MDQVDIIGMDTEDHEQKILHLGNELSNLCNQVVCELDDRQKKRKTKVTDDVTEKNGHSKISYPPIL